MKVSEKNYYKLKPMETTAMKVLKSLYLHVMLSLIKTPLRKKLFRGNQSPFIIEL